MFSYRSHTFGVATSPIFIARSIHIWKSYRWNPIKKIEFIGKFAAFHLVFVFGEGKPISTLRLHSKFSNGCNRSHNWISDWNSPVMYNIKPKNGKKKTATRKVFSEVGWKRNNNNNNNTIILTIFGTNVA